MRIFGSTAVTLLPDFLGRAIRTGGGPPTKAGICTCWIKTTRRIHCRRPNRIIQQFVANPHGLIYSSPAYFDGKVYISRRGRRAQSIRAEAQPGRIDVWTDPDNQGTNDLRFPRRGAERLCQRHEYGIVWSAQWMDSARAARDSSRLQRNDLSDAAVQQQPAPGFATRPAAR